MLGDLGEMENFEELFCVIWEVCFVFLVSLPFARQRPIASKPNDWLEATWRAAMNFLASAIVKVKPIRRP